MVDIAVIETTTEQQFIILALPATMLTVHYSVRGRVSQRYYLKGKIESTTTTTKIMHKFAYFPRFPKFN